MRLAVFKDIDDGMQVAYQPTKCIVVKQDGSVFIVYEREDTSWRTKIKETFDEAVAIVNAALENQS